MLSSALWAVFISAMRVSFRNTALPSQGFKKVPGGAGAEEENICSYKVVTGLR